MGNEGHFMNTLLALFYLIFGVPEFEIGDGRYCDECDNCHLPGKCSRAMLGYCLDCEMVRRLDRFGNCRKGHRSIMNRRLVRLN